MEGWRRDYEAGLAHYQAGQLDLASDAWRRAWEKGLSRADLRDLVGAETIREMRRWERRTRNAEPEMLGQKCRARNARPEMLGGGEE